MLTENFKGQVPEVRVSVLHKSVRLIMHEEEAAEDKKRGINMIVGGMLVFILGTWFVQRKYRGSTTPLIITGIFGMLYLFMGL